MKKTTTTLFADITIKKDFLLNGVSFTSSYFFKASVSLKRMNKFMNADELDPNCVSKENTESKCFLINIWQHILKLYSQFYILWKYNAERESLFIINMKITDMNIYHMV